MHILGFNPQASYLQLDPIFYHRITPASFPDAKIQVFNHHLAEFLELDCATSQEQLYAQILSAQYLLPGSLAVAQAYCGHQFGSFNQLGDGRACLLLEHQKSDGSVYDLHLKGVGRSIYSRPGSDGRASLSAMLREYVISEAMSALQIPTTRSLAVLSTGDPIRRERLLPGAILARIASSHIRVGTFQFAAMQQESQRALQSLLSYSIQRHYPCLKNSANPALDFLQAVGLRQMQLIVAWMRVGFIHGVMNTDNMSIAGETLDYGPCAFMDIYQSDTVLSSIDHTGRYSFANQPTIALWNLARLAECLLPLISTDEAESINKATTVLLGLQQSYHSLYEKMLMAKMGLDCCTDATLGSDLLEWMQENKKDYTNTFIALEELLRSNSSNKLNLPEPWLRRWRQQLARHDHATSLALMENNNPKVIPRNHLVQQALSQAEKGDMSDFDKLLAVLQKPYERGHPEHYQRLPDEHEKVRQTFCGT